MTTLDDRIPPYIQKICKRDPFSGKVVTGGIITVKDSSWLMSYTLNRQPHFKAISRRISFVVWVYGLFGDVPGNYVKKPMRECTGTEITEEWLYHLGVPEDQIHDMAVHSARCIPCMMPYITAFFMPRDCRRPAGRSCRRDGKLRVHRTVCGYRARYRFTTEYSVRTGMEAVYTLLDIDRGVPEVFNSVYDVRVLLDSTYKLLDKRKLQDVKVPWLVQWIEKKGLKKIKGTVIEELLEEYHLI